MDWDPDLCDMERDCSDCWGPDLREELDRMSEVRARDHGPSIGMGTVALGVALAAADARKKAKEQAHGEASLSGCLFPFCLLSAMMGAIADQGLWEGLLAFWPIWLFIALIKIDDYRANGTIWRADVKGDGSKQCEQQTSVDDAG